MVWPSCLIPPCNLFLYCRHAHTCVSGPLWKLHQNTPSPQKCIVVRGQSVSLCRRLYTLCLQNLTLLLLWLVGEKRCTCCVFKDFADTFVGLGRAFEVLVCANLLADILSLEIVVLKMPCA